MRIKNLVRAPNFGERPFVSTLQVAGVACAVASALCCLAQLKGYKIGSLFSRKVWIGFIGAGSGVTFLASLNPTFFGSHLSSSPSHQGFRPSLPRVDRQPPVKEPDLALSTDRLYRNLEQRYLEAKDRGAFLRSLPCNQHVTTEQKNQLHALGIRSIENLRSLIQGMDLVKLTPGQQRALQMSEAFRGRRKRGVQIAPCRGRVPRSLLKGLFEVDVQGEITDQLKQGPVTHDPLAFFLWHNAGHWADALLPSQQVDGGLSKGAQLANQWFGCSNGAGYFHEANRFLFAQTLHIRKVGYRNDRREKVMPVPRTQKMQSSSPSAHPAPCKVSLLHGWISEGVEWLRQNKVDPDSIAILNPGDRHNPGGAVLSGARAGEESFCRMCCDLYLSLLEEANKDRPGKPGKKMYPFAFSERFYTEDVRFFRHEVDQGYAFHENPYTVGVVTVAAPDTRNGRREPLEKVHETWQACFEAAITAGKRNLVVTAIGCGAFRCPPTFVAKALAKVIAQHKKHFDNIVVAIHEDHNDKAQGKKSNFSLFKKGLEEAAKASPKDFPPVTQIAT